MLRALLTTLLIVLAVPAMAQDNADWRFGGDAFMAGRNVTLSGDPVDDFFAAGDRVTARSAIEGSAHMAGRRVTLEGRVGENFYGAGQSVDVEGPVAGDVTILGESLIVSEPVSGDLRAMGARVDVTAPVAGNAILAGETVFLDDVIAGDVSLAAAEVEWGDAAAIEGELHVYADSPDDIAVPDRIAASDRVFFHETRDFEGFDGMPGAEKPSFLSWLRGWLGGILAIGLLGTIFAAVAPGYLASLRERALDNPVRVGLWGFVGLSALTGSVVFLAMTGIGLLLVPVSLIAAVLLGIAGYVIGTYALGVWAVGVAGRGTPDGIGDRAIAAFAGAAIGALVCLLPWIGWLAVMAIFFVGAGALVLRMWRGRVAVRA